MRQIQNSPAGFHTKTYKQPQKGIINLKVETWILSTNYYFTNVIYYYSIHQEYFDSQKSHLLIFQRQ